MAQRAARARTGTPQPIVDRIAGETIATLKEPEIVRSLAVVGVEVVGAGPADYAKALKSEVARVADAVRIAGIQPQ